MIDELKLYNYALSADQIKADFNNKDSLSISSNSLNALQTMKKNASVTLTTSRKYIETGRTVKLTSGVTYKTSNAKVFTVDKKGNVKAVGKGSAKLTITHGGISKTYTVKVR
jgi:N6-adenosine-specific RNA methylase IME4